jgi:predicted dehydrogenase
MINIAIIGAGQIGSRHLQALSYLEEHAVIQVVDPLEQSRKTAEERFNDTCNGTINNIKHSFTQILIGLKALLIWC